MIARPYPLADLLAECSRRGVRLFRSGRDELMVDAPIHAMTDDFLDLLEERKPALLDFLELYEERAAIREFDGGLSRHDADLLAWWDAQW